MIEQILGHKGKEGEHAGLPATRSRLVWPDVEFGKVLGDCLWPHAKRVQKGKWVGYRGSNSWGLAKQK
jgi:hypothetical protein